MSNIKRKSRRVDHTGKKYNKWTVIRFAGISKSNGGAIWLCRCNCGIEMEVLARSMLSGASKGCVSCGTYDRSECIGTMSLCKEIWRGRYSDGDLTVEEFFTLSQQDCFYSGAKPSNKRSHRNPEYCKPFIYNGLDKIDSNGKHTKDNVVPCCWPCNEWRANWTQEEFLIRAAKIAELETKRQIAKQREENKQKVMKLVENVPENFFEPIWE